MSDPKALLNIVKNSQPYHKVKSDSKVDSIISKPPPSPPPKMKPMTMETALGLSQLQRVLSEPPPPPPPKPRSRVNPNEHSRASDLETIQVIKRRPQNKPKHKRCNVDPDELEDIQKDLDTFEVLSEPPLPPPPRSRVNPNAHSRAPDPLNSDLETTQVIKRRPTNLKHERRNVDPDELEDIQKDLDNLMI